MKSLLILMTWAFIITSCNSNQSKAKNLTNQIQSITKNSAGTVLTSETGYSMSAKINGKEWTANAMYPTNTDDSKRIMAENNGVSIGFTLGIDWQNMAPGNERKFTGNNVADVSTNDEVGTWDGNKGEVIITKVENGWAEGTFHFTATSFNSDKTLQVTDGKFRFQLPK